MEIIKRKAALAAGLGRYFTGKPCKNGHIEERHATSGRCIGCIRAWSTGYYERDRDEILAGLAQRRLQDHAFAQACRERAKDYYHRNRDAVLERIKAAHKTDSFRAMRRAYYAEKRDQILEVVYSWRKRNADKLAATHRLYRMRNPGRMNAKTASRQRHIRKATPPWADRLAIRAIYEQAAAMGMHVDHIVPLRSKLVCGLHCEANLRALPRLENLVKGNRHWPDMP